MATANQILDKQLSVRQKLDYLYLSLLDKYIDEYKKTHPEAELSDDLISLNELDMRNPASVATTVEKNTIKGLNLHNLSTDSFYNLLNEDLTPEERDSVRNNMQNLIILYQNSGVKLPEYVSNDFMKTRMFALHHKANEVLEKRLQNRLADDEKINTNEDKYQEDSSKARNALGDKKAIKQELKKIKGIEKSENRKLKRQIGRKGIRELKKQKEKDFDKYAKEHLKMSDSDLAQYKYLLEQNEKLEHPRQDLIAANKNRMLSNFSVRAKAVFRGLGSGVATLGRGVKYVGIGVLKGLKHLALLPVHIYRTIAKKSEENMNKGFENLVQGAVDDSIERAPVEPAHEQSAEQAHEQSAEPAREAEDDPRKAFADELRPEQTPAEPVKPVEPDIPNILNLSDKQLASEQGKALNELVNSYENAVSEEDKNKSREALEAKIIELSKAFVPEQASTLLAQSILNEKDPIVRNSTIAKVYNTYEANTRDNEQR